MTKLNPLDAVVGQEDELEVSEIEILRLDSNTQNGVDIDYTIDGFEKVVRGMDPVDHVGLLAGMMKAWLADTQYERKTGNPPRGYGQKANKDKTALGRFIRRHLEASEYESVPSPKLVEAMYALIALSQSALEASKLIHLFAMAQGDRIYPSEQLMAQTEEGLAAQDVPPVGLTEEA